MPQYYLKRLGGATKVVCESYTQMLVDSEFLRDLHADGDTAPGVQYLMIVSRLLRSYKMPELGNDSTEELVTPYTNGFLRSHSSNVQNQVLKDWCPVDVSEHVLIQVDLGVTAPFPRSAWSLTNAPL
ncbi:hypothetical protein BGZ70_010359 [Mortierella alpina]|uniref:Uncharacterized protein n=1 Tax=Mortierella alpina TaxID=64518 RepID=A0A9P6LZQ0_MORAP|nr:hypothetical protein BGZ70_010359 [Mortierella alpina]